MDVKILEQEHTENIFKNNPKLQTITLLSKKDNKKVKLERPSEAKISE